eukprot:m.81220 g.81220  ORF g.81220 m.81220 type:complete len:76 (-) comp14239_c0_seq2:1219-1446(-)
MTQIDKIKAIRGNKTLRMATELLVIAVSVAVGVPPALAAFPQRDSLPVSKLEPKFANLFDKEGRPIDRVFFNKGL